MAKHPRRRYAPAADTPGVAARRSALRLLDAVMRRGEPLEIAFHAATQGLADRADRGLAHAIAAEVLRRKPDLDALIDSVTDRVLPTDAKARVVLAMALVQVLILKTPAHAAIATALPLVEGGPRKLVHGVFGALIRDDVTLPAVARLPEDLAERWTSAWGEDMVTAAGAALVTRPPVDVALRDAKTTAHWTDTLGGMSLMPGHVRLPDHADVTDLPGFAEGAWWVQDLAASLPARLAGAGEGRRAFDLCAAPGGKAMQLSAAGWAVTALDQSARRLERLSENFERTGLPVTPVQADVATWKPEQQADLVLLDAPCSATGIFRRHPDVIHRIGPRQIAELAEIQNRLLHRAAQWVAPGGQLIYATCSLEPSEGEEQIVEFVKNNSDFAIDPPSVEMLPAGILPHVQGWIRTGPQTCVDVGGVDGFFIVRLRRRD